MAQAENVQALNTPSKLQMNEGIIEGKVTSIEQPQNSEYTYYNLSLKAKDEYSMPSTVSVSQSAKERPIAREGDLIRLKVSMGGYPRRANGNTYVTNTLSIVEVL